MHGFIQRRRDFSRRSTVSAPINGESITNPIITTSGLRYIACQQQYELHPTSNEGTSLMLLTIQLTQRRARRVMTEREVQLYCCGNTIVNAVGSNAKCGIYVRLSGQV